MLLEWADDKVKEKWRERTALSKAPPMRFTLPRYTIGNHMGVGGEKKHRNPISKTGRNTPFLRKAKLKIPSNGVKSLVVIEFDKSHLTESKAFYIHIIFILTRSADYPTKK
jgi:hypothetical protein